MLPHNSLLSVPASNPKSAAVLLVAQSVVPSLFMLFRGVLSFGIMQKETPCFAFLRYCRATVSQTVTRRSPIA